MRSAAAVALLAAALLVPATARAANTYDVFACTAGVPGNNLFTASGTTGSCGSHLTTDRSAPATLGAASFWQVQAPPTTHITSFSLDHAHQWSGGPWGAQVESAGVGSLAGPAQLPISGGSQGLTTSTRAGIAVTNLKLVSWCAAPAGCATGAVHSQWDEIRLTIEDAQAPAVANPAGSAWSANGAWLSGTQPLTFGGSDPTGVRRTRVEVDPGGPHGDGWPVEKTFGCDFGLAVPCAQNSYADGLDTRVIDDGTHVIRLGAQDPAGNWGWSATRALAVDNHAPAAPAVSVDGGEAFRSSPDWTLRWANPAGQFAPIVAASYSACPSGGGACASGRLGLPAGSGGSGALDSLRGSFGIVKAGDYTVRLWLEDSAGNVDSALASSPLHLRFDDSAPGQAQPQPPPRRWLGAAEAGSYREPIGTPVPPPSGVGGYAVTADGSPPSTAANLTADAQGNALYGPPAGGWTEGTVTVKARAISGAGVASGAVGQAVLRFDRTPPTTRAWGYGHAADWQPGPVHVTLNGTDALSGMGAADSDRPADEGGRITWSLDGGATQTARGDDAEATVPGSGRHTLAFRAYDVAGNASAERTLTVGVGNPVDGPAAPPTPFRARSLTGRTTFSAAATFAAPCPQRVTLTPARDTWIDQSQPGQPGGAAASLTVRSAHSANARALLAFDLPPAQGCHVTSAELRLYASASTAGRVIEVVRLGSAWDDSTTWESRPGAAGPPAAPGDVTRQVQDLYRYGDNGLLVRDRDESAQPPAAQSYGSRESVHAPELVVTYG